LGEEEGEGVLRRGERPPGRPPCSRPPAVATVLGSVEGVEGDLSAPLWRREWRLFPPRGATSPSRGSGSATSPSSRGENSPFPGAEGGQVRIRRRHPPLERAYFPSRGIRRSALRSVGRGEDPQLLEISLCRDGGSAGKEHPRHPLGTRVPSRGGPSAPRIDYHSTAAWGLLG
jgi:hypothetical protein